MPILPIILSCFLLSVKEFGVEGRIIYGVLNLELLMNLRTDLCMVATEPVSVFVPEPKYVNTIQPSLG